MDGDCENEKFKRQCLDYLDDILDKIRDLPEDISQLVTLNLTLLRHQRRK